MRVLAINCGSSSIKAALVDSARGVREFTLQLPGVDAAALLRELEPRLRAAPPDAVAHRVVHGGPDFRTPLRVTHDVLARLHGLDALAPLHNPPALAVLEALHAQYAVPHVAVFDTAFHATLPPRARELALPPALCAEHGLRRYGFHGISHEQLMHDVAKHLHRSPRDLRILSCHLGNGASVCAIEYGRSVETSMGFTPLEGLVMGTRAGNLDPGVLLELMRQGYDAARLDQLLNHDAGFVGLTGTADLRLIEQRAAAGEAACQRALTLFTHRLRQYLGAYAAVMCGVDVIAFTGGMGEHSALIRARALQQLDFLGVRVDEDRNREARVDGEQNVVSIADDTSRIALLVVRADEETGLARAAESALAPGVTAADRRVPVAVSARHAHLSQATLDRLFGPGHVLKPRADLAQHGQYAAEETVTLIGPRGRLEHVRVLGPPRAADQVEISRSDEFVLGIDAPVRLSGDLANTPGITLESSLSQVRIDCGVVCARRHIHMNPADAARLGLADHAVVAVRIDSAGRDLVFNDVTVRVHPDFALELHLDTDEANAAGVTAGMMAEILA